MQRYFVAPEAWRDEQVHISGDDVHHIVRVMRQEVGDVIYVSDGESRVAKAEIIETSKEEVVVRVIESLAMEAESKVRIIIAQALPKADKMELIVQKGTELGAAAFQPFISARTIVQYDAKKQAKVLERWTKIAKEAAEQAHRDKVPTIAETQSWKQLLKTIPDTAATFICYEKQLGQGLRETVQKLTITGLPIMIVVGPEGGFTEQEIEQAVAAGATAITLGKRILRTETAAMAALSGLMYEFGELGG